MSPTVINYVEEYFHTLNPLAKRIVEEINHTREAYESLWDALSVPEQRQIVDEAIIRPEAVLKYTRSHQGREVAVPEVFPCLRVQTGAKYVVYEDGSSGKGIKWRDEHSAPFSWLTRSQQDLRNFGEPLPSGGHKKMSKSSTPVRRAKPPAPPVPEMDPPSLVLGGSSAKLIGNGGSPSKQTILNRLISKTAVFKLPFASKAVGAGDSCPERESLLTEAATAPRIVKPAVLKPRSPPPPPPPAKPSPAKKPPPPPTRKSSVPTVVVVEKVVTKEAPRAQSEDEEDLSEHASGGEGELPLLPPTPPPGSADQAANIPKTGFEFLDNW